MAAHPTNTHEFKPTSRIHISKEKAKALKIGEEMEVTVKGKVKEISESFDDKSMASVTLEHTPGKREKTAKELKKDLPVADRD